MTELFRHAAEVKVTALSCESDAVSLANTSSGGQAGILGISKVSLEVNGEGINPPTVLQAEKDHPVVKSQETFVLKMIPRIDGTEVREFRTMSRPAADARRRSREILSICTLSDLLQDKIKSKTQENQRQ